MFKIALIKFEWNLAVWIGGGKRQNYKKWDRVIVTQSDVLPLLRLGCTVEWEREITYKEHKDLFKVTKSDIQRANDEFKTAVDGYTFQQLAKFVESPNYVVNCDEAECLAYIQESYAKAVKANEEAEAKIKEAEEKSKKEAESKAKAEKEAKEKLDAEKKANRQKAEIEAQVKAEEEEAKKIEKIEESKKQAKAINAQKEATAKENKKTQLEAEKIEAEATAKAKNEELKELDK